jgi:hypothetical protein
MIARHNLIPKCLAALFLQLSFYNLHAQNADRVDVNGFNVRLYLGYVNEMNVTLFSLTDTLKLDDYILHAQAQGAEIDYEKGNVAARFLVLPRQSEGYIHFYLEKKGIFYHARDTLFFKAIKPNPDTDDFKMVMSNPVNKLNTVKHFLLPKNPKIINSDFELTGLDVYSLERNKMFKVRIWPFYAKVIDGNKYYARQTRNVGDFEIRSGDLRIEKIEKNTFYISPTTKKLGGQFEVYLNNKKVTDKSFLISE